MKWKKKGSGLIVPAAATIVVPPATFAALAVMTGLMSASDYLEDAWLKTLRGNSLGTSFTAPTHMYAKLHTGDPGEAGTSNAYGTTGVDISRQELAFGAPTGSTQIALSGAFTPTWTSLLTGSVSISYISLWDASSSGNCLGSGALTSSVAVNVGDTFILSACTITCD